MSQVLTTPAESLEIAIPSFTCRLTDRIEVDADGVGIGLAVTGPIGEVSTCQNLTDPSQDEEIREEENEREVIRWVCPMRVSMR